MKTLSFTRDQVQQMLPLLRSICREIKARTRSVERLHAEIAGLSRRRRVRRNEIANLEAELAVHKRELRGVGKELERMGCRQDADHPLRIVVPGTLANFEFEASLEDTGFRPLPVDVGA